MKVSDQLKWLAQSTAIFTLYSYIITHFPSADATDVSTEWYSTVVNYNLMHDLNDQAWSNYNNISMLMVGNSTDYDTSLQNYLGAKSEGNLDEALIWGLKTAVFIDDDEMLLSDIVNDNEYYQQYVSKDTLSNVTGYLEAKLGTSASAYYTTDNKVALNKRAINRGGWIYNTQRAISWTGMQLLGWYITTHAGPLAPSPRQICDSTSGACETWSAEITGFTYNLADQLYDSAVGNWPGDHHSYSVIGQKTVLGKLLDICFSNRANGCR